MTTRRGLRRSVRLFRAFRLEQTRPEVFYGALAQDSVQLLDEWVKFDDVLVLDVGAGPAEFAREFRAAGARYVPIDHDVNVPSVHNGGVVATAAALPFADGTADVVFSSNVWEHVAEPERVADELVRVTKPGATILLSYTNWLSPWGGHETSPWHWLGGDRAARRYERKHGHRPKNLVDDTLFRVSVRQGLDWAKSHPDVEVLAARPRYLPDWAAHLVTVPGVREVLTWNLLLILRRRPDHR